MYFLDIFYFLNSNVFNVFLDAFVYRSASFACCQGWRQQGEECLIGKSNLVFTGVYFNTVVTFGIGMA